LGSKKCPLLAGFNCPLTKMPQRLCNEQISMGHLLKEIYDGIFKLDVIQIFIEKEF
jgi:hypothetical protein